MHENTLYHQQLPIIIHSPQCLINLWSWLFILDLNPNNRDYGVQISLTLTPKNKIHLKVHKRGGIIEGMTKTSILHGDNTSMA